MTALEISQGKPHHRKPSGRSRQETSEQRASEKSAANVPGRSPDDDDFSVRARGPATPAPCLLSKGSSPSSTRSGVRTPIVVADKNPVVRAGLKDFLNRDGRFDVIETVNGGNPFISFCEANRIQLGVIGWSLPDMTGGDVLAVLKRRQIPTRVVIYTGESNPGILRQAVKDGAWGFTQKSDDPELLLETLVSVARGRLSLPYVDISSLADDPLQSLTKRERELLKAISNGLTNEQIAARIGISHNTVKYHLKNLYDKIGVRNRAMAVGLYMSIPEDCR